MKTNAIFVFKIVAIMKRIMKTDIIAKTYIPIAGLIYVNGVHDRFIKISENIWGIFAFYTASMEHKLVECDVNCFENWNGNFVKTNGFNCWITGYRVGQSVLSTAVYPQPMLVFFF